jgi:hypothetical protein
MAVGDAKQEPLAQFEIARRRAKQRSTQAGQEATGAIQRRFAALGGLSGGAALKQEQLAKSRAQGIGEEAIQGIDFAEAAEQRRLKEIQEGRAFTSGEAEKQRKFASGEAQVGRDFASGEAQVGRDFAAEQAGIGRDFTAGQADKQRGFLGSQSQLQRDFAGSQADLQRGFTSEQGKVDRAFRKELANDQLALARDQLAFDKDVAEFNKQIALYEQNQPTDIFGQLLGKDFSIDGFGGLIGGDAGKLGNLINPAVSLGTGLLGGLGKSLGIKF